MTWPLYIMSGPHLANILHFGTMTFQSYQMPFYQKAIQKYQGADPATTYYTDREYRTVLIYCIEYVDFS
jgi:hypothetical protein